MTKSVLHLRIISPSKVEYDNEVDMVLLPGDDGEFGVLVDHMNMVTNLKAGVVKIYTSGKTENIDIDGGVLSVYDGNKIDLLTA